MRILYHHRIASKDGQITHIEEMVSALRELGHEVLLVGPEVHKGDSGQGGSAGWVGKLKATLPAALYELAEASYSLVAFRRLLAAVREFKPDVIYERYALFQPAGVWVSRRTGVPLLLEVNAPYAIARRKYNNLKIGWLADWFERYTFRGADRVFPVTQVLADMLVGMGVKADRIRVIPNGINPADFANLPTVEAAKARFGLQGRTVIGFIGFVREWDRLDRIVTWLAQRPPEDPATLFIVGDGPVRADLEAQARAAGVAHKLVFSGVVPRSDVPRSAMAFDIALQTALVPYASPLCLFEYMAMGKAILAPDQPNHHEVLDRRGGLANSTTPNMKMESKTALTC
jgi:glycosyltransferase involved in cell wall biosynthesis